MDDIIFLIIAVAISIFAAINKSKKKQMEGQVVEEKIEEWEAKGHRNFMDQLLGEDFLEDEEAKEVQPVRVKPTPSKVAFKSSIETRKALNYQLPRFKSTLPDRPKHTTIKTSRRQNEVEQPILELEEVPSYLEDFSLRRAIVYSQIIERKPEWES